MRPTPHCEDVVHGAPCAAAPAVTQETAPVDLLLTSHVWLAAQPHCGVSPHALLGATVVQPGVPLEPLLVPPLVDPDDVPLEPLLVPELPDDVVPLLVPELPDVEPLLVDPELLVDEDDDEDDVSPLLESPLLLEDEVSPLEEPLPGSWLEGGGSVVSLVWVALASGVPLTSVAPPCAHAATTAVSVPKARRAKADDFMAAHRS